MISRTVWNSPGQGTGVSHISLLQRIFPTQVSRIARGFFTRILAEFLLSHKGSPRILEWVGSLSLLQWIFLIQKLNQGLLHCRCILYQLSYSDPLLVFFSCFCNFMLCWPTDISSKGKDASTNKSPLNWNL